MEIKDLHETIGWITFLFPDGSKKVVRTTFNERILSTVLRNRKEGQIYDLDKQKWTNLPINPDVTIQVTESKPTIGEVDQFVNQFI